MNNRLPEPNEVKALINSLIEMSRLENNFYSNDEHEDSEMDTLTIGTNFEINEFTNKCEWGFQTGDNSYSGGAYAYRHWAVIEYDLNSDPDELTDNLIDQLYEHLINSTDILCEFYMI